LAHSRLIGLIKIVILNATLTGGGRGMPFVTNQGVRIHYDTIGNGPALVMHHGTFGSGTDFIDLGYVEAFKADHQVVLLDSRGHGLSRTILILTISRCALPMYLQYWMNSVSGKPIISDTR
jgi:pimeloyl-ACP methyl ester carboxylesterase